MNWKTGRLLDTPTTRGWTPEQRERGDQRERRGIYEGFTSEDNGRSRRLIAECETREQAEKIVSVIATLTASLASERERVEALDVQLQEVQADYGELDAKLFAEVDRADKAETAFNQCAEENHRNVNRSMVAESECADARASLAAAEAELDTWKFVFGVDESTKYLTLEQAEIMWRDRITAARSEAVAHAFEWLEKRGFYRKTVGDSPLFEFVGPVLDFPAYLAHLSKEPTK